MNRRELVSTLPLAAAGALSLRSFPALAQANTTRVPLGVQFFTFVGRDGAAMGFDKYAEKLAIARKIGYDGVELAGLSGYKPENIRASATKHGLEIPSVHCGFDQVFGFLPPPPMGPDTFTQAQDATYTPVAVVQIIRAMAGPVRDVGARFATVAAGGKLNFTSIDRVMRFADGLNQANVLAKEKGLTLSFHPHAPEFTAVEGRVPFDLLIANTDPSIRYELDVYWSTLGGGDGDPVAIIHRYAKRIGLFHLKDMDKEKKIATPGDGTLDFAAIKAAAAKCDNPYFFVERDAAPDPVDAATRSFNYLHTLGYGKCATA